MLFAKRLFVVYTVNGDIDMVCGVASGSMDGNIVVWSSNLPKPVIVFKAFFEQSVLDLSWFVRRVFLCVLAVDGYSCDGVAGVAMAVY